MKEATVKRIYTNSKYGLLTHIGKYLYKIDLGMGTLYRKLCVGNDAEVAHRGEWVAIGNVQKLIYIWRSYSNV